MKMALIKDGCAEIKKNFRRFIALVLMSFLGVGFFAGIRAASSDMELTIDKYYKDSKVFDINVVSTLGITESDFNNLKNLDGVEAASLGYEKDKLVRFRGNSYGARVMTYDNNFNVPKLSKNKELSSVGEMPENDQGNLCLADPNLISMFGFKVGDLIELYDDDFKYSRFRIAAVVDSPIYMSKDRGNNKYAGGRTNFYIYIPKSAIKEDVDVYTNVYIRVRGADRFKINSNEYNNLVDGIIEKINAIKGDSEKTRYETVKKDAEDEINKAQDEIDNKLVAAKKKIEDGLKKIDKGLEKLEIAKNDIINREKSLEKAEKNNKINKTILKFYEELSGSKKEIEINERKLKAERDKLLSDSKTLDDELKKANLDIKQAREDLKKIKYPKWYIFNRDDNSAYNGFIRDISSVAKLGGMFPLILFLIAALISLNSMARMVEEQRIQIGTLKALGYSSVFISLKYIAFAFIACVIGGLSGMSVGFVILPKTIWQMYELDYSLPNDLTLSFDYKNGGIGLLIMLSMIILATVAAICEELKEVPAVLIRPKAPKKAKRVLLEKVGFIWRALNFSQKVTIRNIFRYKKRFLMTIIGIMGCTSLVVSGFGLRDSVSNILGGQYGKVFDFDMIVRLSENIDKLDENKAIFEIEKLDNIRNFAKANMSSISLKGKNRNYEAQLIVPDNIDELRRVINLRDKNRKRDIEIDTDKVYLSDKLAELLDAKIGSEITVISGDEKAVKGTVGGIVENYLLHYVYVSKEFFDKNVENYYINTVILKNEKNSRTEEDKTVDEILAIDNVETVILSSALMSRLSVMMNSLNYVVIILVLAAALLNFIVLYNLATLNISERSREIATIKVLGFYDREVYSYLDRETIILTFIGIICGLFAGHYLNSVIVKTCEVDIIRFTTDLSITSYIISAVISSVFAFLVNIITYFSLKRVNMTESLKSVE